MSDKKHYNKNIKEIQKALLPYFEKDGVIDVYLDANKIAPMFSYSLADVMSYQIDVHDPENSKQFCYDDVSEHRMVIENNNLIRFWCHIFWLQTPKDYPIHKSAEDPLYIEFKKENGKVHLSRMCFGDYGKRKIEKAWLLGIELDWVYEFNF
jgi:hypothetical protein